MFTRNLPYVRDDKFWVWMNRIITERSVCAVAECDGKIIGHYGILPFDLSVNGETIHAGHGVHAFTEPEYRQRLFIFKITEVAYKEAQKRGIDLVYGFPNINYRLIQEKIEKWKRISLFNAYELASIEIASKPVADMRLEEVDAMDFSDLYQIDSFLDISKKSSVYIKKSARFWLERYYLHPQSLYKIYRILKVNELVGYVVLKHYRSETERRLHIVDYVICDNELTADFLHTFLLYAKDKCDKVCVWKGDEDFEREIIANGFNATGFDTFLGIKFLNEYLSDEIRNTLLNFANWRLVMGDSDAF